MKRAACKRAKTLIENPSGTFSVRATFKGLAFMFGGTLTVTALTAPSEAGAAGAGAGIGAAVVTGCGAVAAGVGTGGIAAAFAAELSPPEQDAIERKKPARTIDFSEWMNALNAYSFSTLP